MPPDRVLQTSLFQSPAARSRLGWLALRITLAGLIAAHGWARLSGGAVQPFGTFLESEGFPMGFAWAAAITGLEIIGSVVLAFGRLVLPLTLLFAFLYAFGIALVHAKEGWFVVGLGRNGAEFSVLLIVCLLCVGLQHAYSDNKSISASEARE